MEKQRILKELEPQKVFYYFENLMHIPHGSSNEKAISDYIVKLAKKQGYAVRQDDAYNVVVELPASSGYEERKKTIIQAHLDMVCVKDEKSSHDFMKDPIDIYIDGDYIKAKGTSLGADDGSGVALMLAIMTDRKLKHPPLQLLFTTGEEILFTGASAMSEDFIEGEQLIGLDCSNSNTIVASCAGISISHIVMPIERFSVERRMKQSGFVIRICGLQSGHSGNLIHTGRVNGIKLLGEILSTLEQKLDYDVLHINGNGLVNVICGSAEAEICCCESDEKKVEKTLSQLFQVIMKAYGRIEPDLKLSVERKEIGCTAEKLSYTSKKRLLQLIELLPFGVKTMMGEPFNLAESSMNIGYVEEGESLKVGISVRSNNEYQHENLLRKLKYIAEIVDGKFVIERRSAPWEYNPDSSLRRMAERIYRRQNKQEPEVKVIHASVEAGVFVEKMKRRGKILDVINIGCDQDNVHTVNECLKISSVGKVYRFLTALLEETD